MLKLLIIKELKLSVSSPRLLVSAAVITILIFAAFTNGVLIHTGQVEETEKRVLAEKDRLANVYNFPLDVARSGISLHRPPDVLSMIVSGVEGDAARRGNVNYYYFPGYDVSIYNTTPILAVFGILDVVFVVKILLSLFAILFTFDSISGEKETGGLRMIFANPVRRGEFVLAKFISASVQLLFLFLIPYLFSIVAVSFVPGISFGQGELMRIGLLTLSFVLFIITYTALGIAVSALTERTVVSFLILLMLWVLFNGIVPRMSVWIAQNILPVPPADEVKKVYFIEFGEKQEQFAREINQILKPYVENPVLLFTSRDALMKRITAEHEEFTQQMEKRGQELSREQDLKQEQQNQLAISIARYSSPSAALTFATNRLGRTGVYSSYSVFKDTVEGYKTSFDVYVRQQIRDDPDLFSGSSAYSELKRDESALYPEPGRFKKEPFNVSATNAMIDISVITLYALLFFAIGFTAFLRYDVR